MSRLKDVGDEIAERFFEKLDEAVASGRLTETLAVLREVALAGVEAGRAATTPAPKPAPGYVSHPSNCRGAFGLPHAELKRNGVWRCEMCGKNLNEETK